MTITFLGTLFLKIETAVLFGILLSFILYVRKTSTPHVHFLLPDDQYKHFIPVAGLAPCPQLSIMEIHGDIYFGAVSHIEEEVLDHLDRYPDERYLLVRMHSVNQLDFSGIYALENIVKLYRERGGDVFFVRTVSNVRRVMEQTNFVDFCGENNFLDEDEAISHLFYRVLDPTVCIYECPVRAFKECQNLPKFKFPQELPVLGHIPTGSVEEMPALALYQALHTKNSQKPLVLDVREPREYRHGHIPEAELKPLRQLLTQESSLPQDRPIVLICRSGRRSRRAAFFFQENGYENMKILKGGLLAWEDAGFLEAVDYSAP
jgi:SulP family sulfate permease